MLISSLVISILNVILLAYLVLDKKRKPQVKSSEILSNLIYDFEHHGYSIIRISPDSILYRRLP